MAYCRRWLAGLAAAVVMGVAVQAGAVEFRPFADVENVCPSCEQRETDEVTLQNGDEIRCTIVAANQDFWVVERYGEVRAIPNGQVQSRSFADGSPPSDLRSQDQVVLNNGHVVTGTIVDESDKPGHYQIKSKVGNSSIVVFKSEAQALYRSGSKKTIEAPKTGKSSGGS